jgi:hypothetical protein
MYKYAFVLPLIVLMYFAVNNANANNEPNVSLVTNVDLKAYEGYYKFQFKPGKDSYIRVMAKNNRLVLHELWTGREIIFEQKSELEFFNKSERFPLKFTKSQDGAITQVLAFDRDLWNKDNEYRPKPKTAIAMTTDQLKSFEGYYQLPGNKETVVKVTANGNDLIVQNQWNDVETTYSPESEMVFFVKSGDNDVTIKFDKDDKGNVKSGTDFTGKTWNKVDNYKPRKAIHLTAKQLQAYEGQYTFEFKPGKSETIFITARDGNLTLKESWSGNEIVFLAESDLDFFSKQRPFPLKFTKDEKGNITHVLAFEKDLWTKVKNTRY